MNSFSRSLSRSIALGPVTIVATTAALTGSLLVALPDSAEAGNPCRVRTTTHLDSTTHFAGGGVLRRYTATANGSAKGGYDQKGKVLMTSYGKNVFPTLINTRVGIRKPIGKMVREQHRKALGAIDGDFFSFPDIRGVNDIEMSRGPMVRNGHIIRGTAERRRVVGVTAKREPFGGMLGVRGFVRLKGSSTKIPIQSLNWQNTKAGGVNIYTTAWSDLIPRPRGRIEWVLNQRNRIREVRSLKRNTGQLGDPVRDGTRVLAFSKNVADQVRGAKAGQQVFVNIRQSTAPKAHLYTAIGRGLPVVLGGVPAPLGCGAYDHSKAARPRTFVGWNKWGRWKSFTVPGSYFDGVGLRMGGFGLANAANIARSLGMKRAFELDGGGSTTLYTRAKSGQWHRRDLYGVDTSVCACERPMTNGFAFVKR